MTEKSDAYAFLSELLTQISDIENAVLAHRNALSAHHRESQVMPVNGSAMAEYVRNATVHDTLPPLSGMTPEMIAFLCYCSGGLPPVPETSHLDIPSDCGTDQCCCRATD